MPKSHRSLEEIEQEIGKLPPNEQAQLLKHLPKLLALRRADLSMLQLAESSFDFWDNPDDAAYDTL